jgi:hypothetical protein
MKLYVDQIDGDGAGGRSFVIYNEAGEKLRGVRSAVVRHACDDAARIDLSLVVNGRDIVFGKPPALKG